MMCARPRDHVHRVHHTVKSVIEVRAAAFTLAKRDADGDGRRFNFARLRVYETFRGLRAHVLVRPVTVDATSDALRGIELPFVATEAISK